MRLLADDECLEQVGVSAMRAPDGSFLPSEPIYKIVKRPKGLKDGELTAAEAEPVEDIKKILAEKFKQYIDGVRAAGLKI